MALLSCMRGVRDKIRVAPTEALMRTAQRWLPRSHRKRTLRDSSQLMCMGLWRGTNPSDFLTSVQGCSDEIHHLGTGQEGVQAYQGGQLEW